MLRAVEGERVERLGAWIGVAFVVLLFASTGMVSSPAADVADLKVARFYGDHRSAVAIAQVVGLLAAPLLIWFAVRLHRLVRPSPAQPDGAASATLVAGVAVALASVATSVPLLVLLLRAGGGRFLRDPAGAGALFDAGNLADNALFVAAALFIGVGSAALARSGLCRSWVPWVGGALAVLAGARGIVGFANGSEAGALDVIGPLSFVVFVLLAAAAMAGWRFVRAPEAVPATPA